MRPYLEGRVIALVLDKLNYSLNKGLGEGRGGGLKRTVVEGCVIESCITKA